MISQPPTQNDFTIDQWKELDQLCLEIYESFDSTQLIDNKNEKIRRLIETILKRNWQNVQVILYGSAISHLQTLSSDVDYCIFLEEEFEVAEQRMKQLVEMKHVEWQIKVENSQFLKQQSFLDQLKEELLYLKTNLNERQKSIQNLTCHNANNEATQDRIKQKSTQELTSEQNTENSLNKVNLDKNSPEEEEIRYLQRLFQIISFKIKEVKQELIKMKEINPIIESYEKAYQSIREVLKDQSNKLKNIPIIYELTEKLNHSKLNCTPITHPKVPIIKLKLMVENFSEICCDIALNNMIAVYNSQLISTYANFDTRVQRLMALIKIWVKNKKIGNASCGGLSSYAFMIMCIHYCQQLRPPVLPNVQHPDFITPELPQKECNGLNITFCSDVNFARKILWGEKLLDARHLIFPTVAQLLRGFFHYYAHFNFNDLCISINCLDPKGTIPKSVWKVPILWRISIEDPFETHNSCSPHDLGCTLTIKGQTKIIDAFEEAYDLTLQNNHENWNFLFSSPKPVIQQEDTSQSSNLHVHSPIQKEYEESKQIETSLSTVQIQELLENEQSIQENSTNSNGTQSHQNIKQETNQQTSRTEQKHSQKKQQKYRRKQNEPEQNKEEPVQQNKQEPVQQKQQAESNQRKREKGKWKVKNC